MQLIPNCKHIIQVRVHIDNRRVLLIDFGNKTTIGHSSMSSHGRLKALQKNIQKTPRPPRNQKNLWQAPLLSVRHSLAQLLLSQCLIIITWFLQFCSLRSLCFSCIGCLCTLTIVGPKGYSSVCRGWQEGKILRMPPALNNFVLVLSYHHQRKLLREVSCSRGTSIISHVMNLYPTSLLLCPPFFVFFLPPICLLNLTYIFHLIKHTLTPLSHIHTQSIIQDPSVSVFRHYWTHYKFKIQEFTTLQHVIKI